MTTRQTRQNDRDAVNRRSKTSSGKRNMQEWQWKRCGKWKGEEYGDTTPFENIGLPLQGLQQAT